jgi:hypothetical protein
MRHKLWIGLIVGGFLGLLLTSLVRSPQAMAQRNREEAAAWEYKVALFSYNPGERLTDEQRAAFYEKTLNEQAKLGWEPVGSLMSRNVVQTVGGGVTTRDSVSFVAYRRPKR